MPKKSRGSAAQNASQTTGGKSRRMTQEELQEKLVLYRIAMSLALEMWNQGIITDHEYNKIDRIIADYYGLKSSTIFCRNPLISSLRYGNMVKIGGEIIDRNCHEN